jgi:CRISP-associated protein Cas1
MEIVLNSYGTALHREDIAFVVVHKDGRQRIPAEKVRSIVVGKGASISSDAALLAIENEIEVVFVSKSGNPEGRLWSVRYGSVSTIRRNQLDFTLSPKAVEWIKSVIAEKLNNQIALLLTISGNDPVQRNVIQNAIKKIGDYTNKLNGLAGEIVSDIAPSLRGWEGAASRIYFAVISDIMPEPYRFEGRSRQPALDAFNCLLNYGYGILYGKVESALIKAGIDPYVGVFHRDDYNRPVLVFDVIERYRVWIDYVVINLLMQHAVNEDFFEVGPDSAYWLNNLGKRILIQSVNDYLDEVVQIKGVSRSRQNHINLDAQKLATLFQQHRFKDPF